MTEDSCSVCGDVADPMRVVSIDADTGLACCTDPCGRERDVEVALLEDPRPGDEVLVHAGVAIARLP